MKHEPDGGEGHHGLGDIEAFLVILGQSPPASEPSEGSFDDPPARDDDEAGAGNAPDDDQRQFEQDTGQDHRHPVVNAVGEDGP